MTYPHFYGVVHPEFYPDICIVMNLSPKVSETQLLQKSFSIQSRIQRKEAGSIPASFSSF